MISELHKGAQPEPSLRVIAYSCRGEAAKRHVPVFLTLSVTIEVLVMSFFLALAENVVSLSLMNMERRKGLLVRCYHDFESIKKTQ